MLKYSPVYFLLTLVFLVAEITIALYIPDGFIRHYLGDVLVVILVYCFVRSWIKLPVVPLAMGVLLFAFTIEALQYFKLVETLGLAHSRLARVVLGSTFDWKDMGMYVVGIALVIAVETWRQKATGTPAGEMRL